MGKKKGAGILFLLLMAALIVCLMLTSDMIYQKLSSFGRHDVTPIGNSFTAGEYEGIGQGKIGDIKVRLTLSDSAIESVEVLENSETADIVGDLFETMPAAMVATQSVYDVDDVSGATVSSHALKEAVGNAFLRAGFDAHNLTPVATPELEAPVETEMTAGEVPAPDGNLSFEKPGTYTATEVSSIGGDVSVTATFSEDGIEDISCENNETPEIGGAAVDTLIDAVKTSQSLDVDMVSGATLTSEAFLKALKSCAAEAGLAGLDAPAETEEEKEEKEEVPAETEPVELSVTAETEAEEIEASGLSFEKPGTYTASEVSSIGGDVIVTATFSEDGIEDISCENNETPTIGGAAVDTLIDAVKTSQSLDVDMVSGATLTSEAFLKALKSCAAEAGLAGVDVAAETEEEKELPAETEAEEIEASGLSFEKPGTYTASEVSSIGGDVIVTATFSEDGIEDISCENNETPTIGGAAVDTLIDAVKTSQSLDVDMVSGATLTSEAFLKALKSCAAEAGLAGADAPAETEEEKELPAETEAEEIEASGLSFEKPGTYTASEVSSIGGDVIVTATFSKDGIEDISCENNETPTIGGAAVDTLIDAVKTGQSLDVDMVSGATVTSEAFLKALKDCAEQAGCLGFEQTLSETEAEEEESSTVKSEVTPMSTASTGVTVTAAADWEEKYPLQYASFMRNNENNEVVEYTEQDPYIKVLYEGYGFAVSYGSARGHTYVIEDLYATGRPHKLANCFTCKTSDFTARVLSEGDSAYAMEFDAFKSEVNDPFGCFHCHENEPGVLHVTHGYLTNALGEDADKVDLRTQTCGQCHSEYYFDPATKATTLGYHGLDNMNPDDILAYENTIVDGEGNMFADWVDESTGVRKLKAQHPEFETYYGSTHDKMKVTCAECHMAKEKTDDGEAYSSHYWISPLQSESIMENTCAACHGDAAKDLPERVAAIQKETRDRENEIGKKLQELDEKLSDAVKKGDLDEDELDEIRLLSRNAQFYWDFVYVENSEGVHNSALTKDCLDKAEKIADEAFAKLA